MQFLITSPQLTHNLTVHEVQHSGIRYNPETGTPKTAECSRSNFAKEMRACQAEALLLFRLPEIVTAEDRGLAWGQRWHTTEKNRLPRESERSFAVLTFRI